ncbi:MAG: DUF4236 domain-containing protein [Hyphomicrobium sp.]|nr:DUF4236 domain-containing protein [Hyphomicrobium sp.]
MAFRFRKSFKVLPGVRLNVSKSGLSTSVGPRGAKLNFSKDRTTATVGLPGTGLSHTSTVSRGAVRYVRAYPMTFSWKHKRHNSKRGRHDWQTASSNAPVKSPLGVRIVGRLILAVVLVLATAFFCFVGYILAGMYGG